ncbi:MAG: hypothetical protein ACRD0F_07850 [Acidimicrobiales bacterium]
MTDSPDAPDPTVSAIVHLRPKPGLEKDPPTQDTVSDESIAKVKMFFTKAGFEVHAPFHASFSIGAKVSKFEQFFGDTLSIDENSFAMSVTTAAGGRELSLEVLPDGVKQSVASVAFMAPPEGLSF